MATADSIEYRDVPGFPGYRVGDDGSVWSRWTTRGLSNRWKRKKLATNKHGYVYVNLSFGHNSRYRTFRVHRLVLETFVGPCPDGMECRHLNSIKTDCRLNNLAWGTRDENIRDNHDRCIYQNGEHHTQARLTEESVREIRKRYAAGGSILRELAAEFGVKMTTIHAVIQRRSWDHI